MAEFPELACKNTFVCLCIIFNPQCSCNSLTEISLTVFARSPFQPSRLMFWMTSSIPASSGVSNPLVFKIILGNLTGSLLQNAVYIISNYF